MASKLILYNLANVALGERKLTSLAENRPSRRRLDTVWDAGGVRKALAEGLWNFAMEDVELTYSPSVTPAFGFQYAFDKPEFWVRTCFCSDDERYANKLQRYDDRGDYILADADTIYLKHVSSGPTRGGDLSLWPEKFLDFAAYDFALAICKSTTNSNADKDMLEKERKKKLLSARATDAMDENVRFIPAGSWSRARRGGGSSSSDGGSGGRLIG